MDILNPSNVATPSTFGPDFDMQQDGNRPEGTERTFSVILSAVVRWLA
jgi:hypothetical protein